MTFTLLPERWCRVPGLENPLLAVDGEFVLLAGPAHARLVWVGGREFLPAEGDNFAGGSPEVSLSGSGAVRAARRQRPGQAAHPSAKPMGGYPYFDIPCCRPSAIALDSRTETLAICGAGPGTRSGGGGYALSVWKWSQDCLVGPLVEPGEIRGPMADEYDELLPPSGQPGRDAATRGERPLPTQLYSLELASLPCSSSCVAFSPCGRFLVCGLSRDVLVLDLAMGDYALASDYSAGSGGLIGGDGFGVERPTHLAEGEDGELLPQASLTSPFATVSAVACFQLVPDERYGVLYSLVDGMVFSLYFDVQRGGGASAEQVEYGVFQDSEAEGPTLVLARPRFRYASGMRLARLFLYGREKGLLDPSPQARPLGKEVAHLGSHEDEFTGYVLVMAADNTLGIFSLTLSLLQDVPGAKFLRPGASRRSSDDCYAVALRQQGPALPITSLEPLARELYSLTLLPIQTPVSPAPEDAPLAGPTDLMLVLDSGAGLRSVPLSALSSSATFAPQLLTEECGMAGVLSPACAGMPLPGDDQPETIAASLSTPRDRSFACLLRYQGEKFLCVYRMLVNGSKFAPGPDGRSPGFSSTARMDGSYGPGEGAGPRAIVEDLALPFILRPRQFSLRFAAAGEAEGAISAPAPLDDLRPGAIGAPIDASPGAHAAARATVAAPEFTLSSRSPLNPNHVRIESLKEVIKERAEGQRGKKLGPGARPSGYGAEAPIVPAFEAVRRKAREREAAKKAPTKAPTKASQKGLSSSAGIGKPIKFDPEIHETDKSRDSIRQKTAYSSTCPFPPVFSRALDRGRCSFLGSDGSLNFYSLVRFESRRGGEDGKLVFEHAISPGYHFSSYSLHLCGDLALIPGPKSTCDMYRVSGTLKKPLLTLEPRGAFPHETSFASFIWPQHDLRGLAVSASACSFNVFYYSLPGPQAGMDEAAASSWTQVCSCKIPASVCAGAAFSKVKSSHVLLSHMGLDKLSDSPSVTVVDISRMAPITAVSTRNSPHKRAPGVVALPDFLYPAISHRCQNLFATSACGSDGGEVAVYDVRAPTRAPVRIIRGVNARRMPAQVCFLPEYNNLVSGGEDGRVRVYDLGQGREMFCGPAGPGAVSSLSVSDGGIIYAGFLDGGIRALTFQ